MFSSHGVRFVYFVRRIRLVSSTIYSLCPTFHDYFSSFFFLATWFVATSAFQKGANLNYDETVVYDEAAAIPSYMIVYRL